MTLSVTDDTEHVTDDNEHVPDDTGYLLIISNNASLPDDAIFSWAPCFLYNGIEFDIK